jgi:hypothetical protein
VAAWTNDQLQEEGKPGVITNLLHSSLAGLREIPIWAPNANSGGYWVSDYPLGLLKDLCGLFEEKKIYALQILFGNDIGDMGTDFREYDFLEEIQNHLGMRPKPLDVDIIKRKG